MTPRKFLGHRLAVAREAAGYSSQVVFADKLGWDRSTVNKIEAGKHIPSADVLKDWCDTCGVDQVLFDEMCELARSFNGVIPEWFEAWLKAERIASILRYWGPLIVPGIAQTPAYARELLLASGHDADESEELADVRVERREIFDREDPPDTTIVIDEFVLRRIVGSIDVMREQLAFILELSERPFIVVQVVTAHTHAGLSGGVNLATIDGKPDVACFEAVQDFTPETPGLVRRASVTFNRVLGDAANAGLSREIITKAIEQL
jgi:transcriptional regulator with XRE-family HTH domain